MLSFPTPKTLTFDDALAAVMRPGHLHVKVLVSPAVVLRIPAQDAIRRMLRGEYEFGGTAHRLRWMRPKTPKLPWRACWRTTEAAVAYPAETYAR